MLALTTSSNRLVARVFDIVFVIERLHNRLLDTLEKSHFFKLRCHWVEDCGCWVIREGHQKCRCYCEYIWRKDRLWIGRWEGDERRERLKRGRHTGGGEGWLSGGRFRGREEKSLLFVRLTSHLLITLTWCHRGTVVQTTSDRCQRAYDYILS